MNQAIFEKKDFTLCDVPVPDGYPQSQTHSDIIQYNGRLVLSTSPFPEERDMRKRAIKKILRKLTGGRLGKLTNGEAFENPCLYISIASSDSTPTVFKPMAHNPLVGTPEKFNGIPSFNSDPQVFFDRGQIFVFNRVIRRELNRGNDPGKYHYLTDIYRIDGSVAEDNFSVENVSLFRQFTEPCISPSVIHFRDAYYFVYLDSYSYNDGETFNGMYVIKSNTLDGLKEEQNVSKIEVTKPDNILPWHFSLFQYNNKAYAVIACVERGRKNRCIQMLGEFDEKLSLLRIFETPLTKLSSYRSCAFVDDTGMFVLYNATVNEYFKNDKSVDGRSIVITKMNFEKLLDKIVHLS